MGEKGYAVIQILRIDWERDMTMTLCQIAGVYDSIPQAQNYADKMNQSNLGRIYYHLVIPANRGVDVDLYDEKE